jgi:hypothetical protein
VRACLQYNIFSLSLRACLQAFRSFQLAVSTSYVPLWAYLGTAVAELSRSICSRTGRRQFTIEAAPTWPLYSTVVLLLASLAITFVNWAEAGFKKPGIWTATVVMLTVALYMMLPVTMRGLRVKMPSSFYLRYLLLGVFIVVVALWQQAEPHQQRPK